jgi:1-acyl-sn-glycerol-3-phosphate acyltransferase
MTRRRPPEPPSSSALGSDPFTQSDGTLPYLIKLRERTIRLVQPDPPGEPSGAGSSAPRSKERRFGPPDLGPPIPELGRFEDRDDSRGVLDVVADQLLTREEKEKVELISRQYTEAPYESFGLSYRAARRALAIFKVLYQHYFRVASTGHAALSEKGGAILVGNHGGLLPFDAAMCVVDVALRATPPRLVRTIVDRWVGTLPFVSVFYSRVGQVIGTPENFRELLRRDQLVLVFPEGMAATYKRAHERYMLRPFRVGFVEQSIRNRVPIIPVAFVGPDDQTPILYDLKPLARLLRLPTFPITPTFPWLGLGGLLPYPVKYEIEYGSPFRFYEEFPLEVADDPHAVRYMAEQVRGRVQEMVDRRVLTRRGK